MGIQACGLHTQPVQVITGQFMAYHFHPGIPVMSGQLPSAYKNKEAALFFSNLLSYEITECFHILGIDAAIGNDERTSQLDNMGIAICVSHKKNPFSAVEVPKDIITPEYCPESCTIPGNSY